MSDAGQESPLQRFFATAVGVCPADEAGVTLGERAFLGHLNIRGNPSDQQFLDAVEGATGVGLPLEPNTTAENGDLAALWLGPDEWLVLTAPDSAASTSEALRDALAGRFAAVTDVSGGQTVISLRGRHARDVLAKGCTLDLHPRAFGVGQCAQSHLAKALVTIRQVGDEPSFEVIVRRSFGEYLALWLRDAGLEYGLVVNASG